MNTLTTKGKTPADIRSEISTLLDQSQALLDSARDQQRELTTDEVDEFEQILAATEPLKKELARAEALREKKLQLAESQSLLFQPSFNPVAGVRLDQFPGYGHMSTPRIQHKVPRLTAFANTPEGQRDAYLAGNWWKAVVMRSRGSVDEVAEQICGSAGFDVQMSMTEGSPGSGGYLVPSPLASSIIDVRAQAGVMRRVARIVPMSSETHSEPKLLSGPTVTYPGESGEFAASDESWGQVALTAKKRGILTKVSRELRDDALISVIDQLASRMGHEFALKEDSEGVNGDSTSAFGGVTGLLAALGSAGVHTAESGDSTWSLLDINDFANTMALLPSKYTAGASWICSTNFYTSAMLRALAEAGGNTMLSLAQGIDSGQFLGKPVFFTDEMPIVTAVSTVSALYGNFNEAMMLGDRQGVEIAISDQRYFEFDLIGVRGVVRYDFNVHDSGSAEAGDVGAYVGLKTAAS
jgi:HK97 family phage major capsid protein